jgi:hypothetical protein
VNPCPVIPPGPGGGPNRWCYLTVTNLMGKVVRCNVQVVRAPVAAACAACPGANSVVAGLHCG